MTVYLKNKATEKVELLAFDSRLIRAVYGERN